IALALGLSPPQTDSLDVAWALLGSRLADRRVLLVLDDIWEHRHLKSFMQGAPNCVRLVTTRTPGVLPVRAPCVVVDRMDRTELSDLLGAGLPDDDDSLTPLLEIVDGWPLVARLFNGRLRAEVEAGRPLRDAARELVGEYLDHGVSTLDLEAERRQTIATTVESSLNVISRLPNGQTLTDLFLDLAVFREGTEIPLSLLTRWWRCSLLDMRSLARGLASFSLVAYRANDPPTIQLHDVIRAFLRDRRESTDLATRHSSLVDSWRPEPGSQWSSMPLDEPYVWIWLSYHLRRAGRDDEMLDALRDVRFLAAQVLHADPLALDADFAMMRGSAADVDLLGERYGRIVHMLWDLGTLGGLSALVATLSVRLALEPVGPLAGDYLRAVGVLPDLPHPALLRVLEAGSYSETPAFTWAPDGRRAAMAVDKAVLIEDTVSGETETVFEFDGGVIDVEWSPAGTLLLVALAAEDSPDDASELSSAGGGEPTTPFGSQPAKRNTVYLVGDDEVRNAVVSGYQRVQWSPDGRFVAVSSDCIVLLDSQAEPDNDGLLAGLELPGSAAAWTANDVLAISANGALQLHRVPTGELLADRRDVVGTDVWRLEWSAQEQKLIALDEDGRVKLFGPDLSPVGVLAAERLTYVAVTEAAPLAATCDVTGALQIWDVHDLGLIAEVQCGDSTVMWSSEGGRLATFGTSGYRLWNVTELLEAGTGSKPAAAAESVSWHPSGEFLQSAHTAFERRWSPQGVELSISPADAIIVRWSPDGRTVATIGQEVVRLAGGEGWEWPRPEETGAIWPWAWDHDSTAFLVGFSTLVGDALVAARLDITTPTARVERLSGTPISVSWSSDGRLAALVRNHADESVGWLWDPSRQKESVRAPFLDRATSVEWFGADTLLSALGSELTAYDHASGSLVAGPIDIGEPVAALSSAPRGEHVAVTTATSGVLVIDRGLRVRWQGRGGVESVAWSPDGRFLATADGSYSVCVLDHATGRASAFGVDGGISDLAWHPTEPILAIAARFGPIFLEHVAAPFGVSS
ncbi:MAG: WD40 repeat domain-containing protein, partial [Ilumatobacteraceae bacterium]|nr:WD40 repeat domain-containing protein [Ilumatobacteraceae bacterium]